ncbi:hypothetical protein [Shewanella putrefaciens]|uniref:Uncharacterized protein n=2 Tax=Shewanella putrefaciens TaxID=24 RepID=E6XR96_SHEP2|nr:hypothetical protein [Shewanella putrefaciens]MCT8942308.1 hypothetical protein [Shewanella putrefaciens]QGS50450.1 hypothetical protein FOB89_16845 [Shewanella putrefaciens]
MPILTKSLIHKSALNSFCTKARQLSYAHYVLIVIASPVTRREYIHIGSTAASMPPTVTGATMPILTNPIAVHLAKKQLPQSLFRSSKGK